MFRKWWLALTLGLLAGGALFIYTLLLEKRATGGEKVAVLVAAEALKRGGAISQEDMGVRSVPSAWVDERTLKKKNMSEVQGAVLSVSVGKGQMLQWTDFEERKNSGKGDLAAGIADGWRAMTIPVNNALSLGGLLRPGHRVDILGTFVKGKNLNGEKVALTLLQNIPVLATGQDMEGTGGDERYSTVTLSVGVEQGELLAFASSLGSLSLVLRSYSDMEVIKDIPEIGEADILDSLKRQALHSPSAGADGPIEQLKVRN